MSYGVDQLARDLGFMPTDGQLAAITADVSAPLLVVAGAGSGKTAVMAARAMWAVGKGAVRPEQVLGLTFTVKAAAELGSRLRRQVGPLGSPLGSPGGQTGDPVAKTYHAFAQHLLFEHAVRLGVEPDSRVISGPDLVQLAYEATVASGLDLSLVGTRPATVATELLGLDGRLAEHSVSTGSLREYDEHVINRVAGSARLTAETKELAAKSRARIELSLLVDEFRDIKSGRGVLDFSDLMRFADELADNHPDVGRALREEYRLVLLDEYQDTSFVQTKILSALFGCGHSVTAVGDPLQGIYSWRGASAVSIREFPRLFHDVDGCPARVLSLSVSQRSTPAILSAANRVSAPLRERHGEDAVILAPAEGSRDKSDRPVRTALFETYVEEVDWVADQVARAIAGGHDPGQMAVLCRVNDDVQAVAEALSERGVPSQVRAGADLMASPVALEVLSTLQAAFDPLDNRAVVGLLRGRRWRIGQRDLAILGRRASDLARRWLDPAETGATSSGGPRLPIALVKAMTGVDRVDLPSLAEGLTDLGPQGRYPFSDDARVRLAALAAELADIRSQVDLSLAEVVSDVITRIGLDVEIEVNRRRNPLVGASQRATLARFQALVDDFQARQPTAGVKGFLAWIEAVERLGGSLSVDLPRQPGSVQILTVHGAKGLEWDTVFLPFVVNGLFPDTKGRSTWVTSGSQIPNDLRGDRAALPSLAAIDRKSIIEMKRLTRGSDLLDERQLAYVAVTRARSRLVVSGHWWGPTQVKPREASPFFGDIAEGLAEPAREPCAEPPREGAERPEFPPARRQAVRETESAGLALGPTSAELTDDERRRIESWDAATALVFKEGANGSANARSGASRHESWSASSAMSLVSDPTEFEAVERRPMPRQPSAAARQGTAFHQWVQDHYGQAVLFEPLEDLGAESSPSGADMEDLKRGFIECGYADRIPAAIEWPFSVVLAGRVFTGQIDAVFADEDRWEVVDWKTNRQMDADPLQLAVYRIAWARSQGIDPSDVTGVFAYVRHGRTAEFVDLPDADGIASLMDDALASLAPGGRMGDRLARS